MISEDEGFLAAQAAVAQSTCLACGRATFEECSLIALCVVARTRRVYSVRSTWRHAYKEFVKMLTRWEAFRLADGAVFDFEAVKRRIGAVAAILARGLSRQRTLRESRLAWKNCGFEQGS